MDHNYRSQNLNFLSELYFETSPTLPIPSKRDIPKQLRPIQEIVTRLMALNACFTWVCFEEEDASSKKVQDYIQADNLTLSMTEEEKEIVSTDRETAYEKFSNAIGWKLENMWALAWIIGFDQSPISAYHQICSDTSKVMMYDFLLGMGITASELLSKNKQRSQLDVIKMEDLFYCTHNAVRNAQQGSNSVPEDFDPLSDGAAIQERRHSLTWALSPNTAWKETDLST